MTRVVQVLLINHVKSNPICDDLCKKILVYIVHKYINHCLNKTHSAQYGTSHVL